MLPAALVQYTVETVLFGQLARKEVLALSVAGRRPRRGRLRQNAGSHLGCNGTPRDAARRVRPTVPVASTRTPSGTRYVPSPGAPSAAIRVRHNTTHTARNASRAKWRPLNSTASNNIQYREAGTMLFCCSPLGFVNLGSVARPGAPPRTVSTSFAQVACRHRRQQQRARTAVGEPPAVCRACWCDEAIEAIAHRAPRLPLL